ncbi:MAG: thioredoxin-dependent thiol peroxidase [Spirochaetia bacterium]|jgi:peroxiredoxin Q/BCP|nr:thioredoxin-dependent thiol peroxidase [Spirochaetia bacterium]
MIAEGSKAPDFTLKNEEGKDISLKDFKGKKVVVYFYPKDNTPGCTKEACSFRDSYDDILAKGAVVIGISSDSQKSHENFKNKFSLPFYLLSDPDKKVIKAFGAWGEKSMMGKKYEGILRSTFVIDSVGVVEKVFEKVNTAIHGDEVLKVL